MPNEHEWEESYSYRMLPEITGVFLKEKDAGRMREREREQKRMRKQTETAFNHHEKSENISKRNKNL